VQKPAQQTKPVAPTPPTDNNLLLDKFRRNASLGAGQVHPPAENKEKEMAGEPVHAH